MANVVQRVPFFVWKAYQRRVEAFADTLNVYPVYLHFDWEERTRAHKAMSYFVKVYKTLTVLFRRRPELFYVQAPPTFLVYAALVYARATGARYVVDCHNTMIYDSFWCRLPFVRYALKNARAVIVHNEYVAQRAKTRGIPCGVLMDRPPDINQDRYRVPDILLRRPGRPRVIVPCSYDVDEPLRELQEATRLSAAVDFYFTWYKEKIPQRYLPGFGENVIFTGFLPVFEFNALLAHADAVLVLTSRVGTQPSGATEAVAFQKPLVISDLAIVRSLFPVGCIYVTNTASDIARGVQAALLSREKLADEMRLFKNAKLRQWQAQYEELNLKLRHSVRQEAWSVDQRRFQSL